MNLVVQDTESEPTDDRHEARLTGKRLALLICNVMYPKIAGYHDIVGAAQDADRVEEILSDSESCRFTVCALIDGGLLEVRRAIDASAGRRPNVTPCSSIFRPAAEQGMTTVSTYWLMIQRETC